MDGRLGMLARMGARTGVPGKGLSLYVHPRQLLVTYLPTVGRQIESSSYNNVVHLSLIGSHCDRFEVYVP